MDAVNSQVTAGATPGSREAGLFWLAATVTTIVAYDVLLRLILADTPDIRLSSARWYTATVAAISAGIVTTAWGLTALAGIWAFQEVDAWRHTRSCTDPECAGRREVAA